MPTIARVLVFVFAGCTGVIDGAEPPQARDVVPSSCRSCDVFTPSAQAGEVRARRVEEPFAVEVEVARFRGDAVGAYSFTFDDAQPEHTEVVAPLFDELGFRATFFVVIDWLVYYGWDDWRPVVAAGHEVGSHTMTHAGLDEADAATIRWEIEEAEAAIARELGVEHQTFAFPFSSTSPESIAIVEEHHFAWRGDSTIGVYELAGISVEGLNSRAAASLDSGEWLVGIYHSIDNPDGYDSYPAESLRQHLEFLREHPEWWVDAFGEVSRYLDERDAVAIEGLESTESGVRFEARTGLDQAVYDAALTFVVRGVPGSVGVRVYQRGVELAHVRRGDDVLVDAVPDRGPVDLRFE